MTAMYRPIFLHVLAMLGLALAIGNWAIDVAGSVDAGSDVTCGDIKGAIDAGGNVSIARKPV